MSDTEGTLAAGNNPQEGNNAGEGNKAEGNNQTSSQSLGWRAGLRTDLREDDRFTNFRNTSELAEAYLKQEDRLSKAVLIPGENASEEERKAYKQKLGIPESKDRYELDEDWLKETAYEAELTPEQAKKVGDALKKKQTEAVKGAETKLRETWGGEYEKNLEKAQRAVKTFGPDGFMDYLEETGLGNDPRMIQTMHAFAEAVSEDTLVPGEGGTSQKAKQPWDVIYKD
jgi:hypothetical protein